MIRSDDELVQAYLDGQLDAAETAAVQRRLRAEPALAEQLVNQAREEAIITEWAHAHRAARTADREATQARRRLFFPRRMLLGLTAAAVAATLLFAVLAGWFNPDVGPNAIAELEDVGDVEDVAGEVYIVGASGESTAARSGSRLTAGQRLRTGEGGSAVVVSGSTRLEVGADTSIHLTVGPPRPEGQGKAQRKVFLEQGSVAADFTRQPTNPMLLTTPHGEALLESKSSFLSVPEGTRIEPEAGPVRFRRNDGQSVAVPAGYYAVALPKNPNPMVPRPLPIRQTKPRTTIEEESGPVLAAAISPDGALLAAACSDGSVKLYDTATGALRQNLKAHRQAVRCLAFSPDGGMLASAGIDRKVQLSEPRTGKELGKLQGYKGAIDSLAFSPSGDLLATGGSQGDLPEVRLWNLTTQQEVASLNHHSSGVLAVAFSPDGMLLASAGKDQVIRLVDLATLAVRNTLDGHRAPVTAIAFSPDGNNLVSGGRDRTVRLWDVATGMQSNILPAQANPVRALAFSPDGRLLAAGDVAVRLYDWKTGQERLILRGHKKQISAVVFSPDGKLIATTSLDKTIRLWEVMLEEPEPNPAE